jgi:hypothetical protein
MIKDEEQKRRAVASAPEDASLLGIDRPANGKGNRSKVGARSTRRSIRASSSSSPPARERRESVEGGGSKGEEAKEPSRGARMDLISKRLATLDSRRQELAKKLDLAQKDSDYESFQKIGNNYLGTILQSIDLYIELIKEISSEPVSDELKSEFSEIVKKGSKSQGIELQSEWISNDVSPLYEKVRQICACVYAAVAKIDQEANRID